LLRPKVPRDLETICLKCLEKEPGRRYATAEALAEDLRRWQALEPIAARPAGRVERAVKWVRRNPALAANLALVMLAVVGGAAGLIVLGAIWLTPKPEPPRAVVLIGATGPPTSFRWVSGEDGAVVETAADKPFSVRTSERSLLELSQVSWKRFCLEAEIWHEAGKDSTVGLYFNHGVFADKDQGLSHCYLRVSFADWGERAGILNLSLCVPSASWHVSNHGFEPLSRVPTPDPWRRIKVEYTPEETRVFWDDKRVGAVPQALLLKLRANMSVAETQAFVEPGGVGLYLSKATASFKNVTVKPIP
jgi:hypothetical protein